MTIKTGLSMIGACYSPQMIPFVFYYQIHVSVHWWAIQMKKNNNFIFWSRLRYNNLSGFIQLCITVYRLTPKTFMISINIYASMNTRSTFNVSTDGKKPEPKKKENINKFFPSPPCQTLFIEKQNLAVGLFDGMYR